MTANPEHHVGHARGVERSSAGLDQQAYSVVFDGPKTWILQKAERAKEARA